MHKTINRLFVFESDLAFCRMDIEINLARIDIKKKKEDRMLIAGNDTFVCLVYGMSDGLVFDRTPVHKDELMGFHIPEIVAFREERSHLQPRCFGIDAGDVIEKFLSVDLHDTLFRA